MESLLAQLGGNPFNTPVGQKIEQATDASLASENWALNMEICDLIMETDDGPKDAVKAIRKRLQQNVGKNYTVVMYTLTVLETCVKNCGKRFHLLITQKDFVQDLVKLIGPKNDPPTAVQEKVLSLIQSWADAFRSNTEMQGVVQVYSDLKQKGIEFPMTDLDAMAPIHTPQRSVPLSQPIVRPAVQVGDGTPQVVRPPPVGAVSLSSEQLAKLRSELDVVQGNMRVLGEMLTELTPGKEHESDWELLQELHRTCRAMQARVVELIDKVANEEVTSELLRVNDELNNLFLRYERYEKKRILVTQPATAQPHQQPQPPADSQPLIDLGDSEESAETVQKQLSGLSLASSSASKGEISRPSNGSQFQQDKEFDMFAESRNMTYEKSKATGSTYADNTNLDQVGIGLGTLAQTKGQSFEDDEAIFKLQKERDFDDMEQWLHSQSEGEKPSQESITSSEFDRFLAERSAAAERVPTSGSSQPAQMASVAIRSPPTSAQRRQMDKEETENTLFAL